MAVEYPTAKVSYKGNGSTRTFSFNFPIRKEEHLQVTTTNLTTMEVKVLNLGADYDVVPIDNTYPSDGGSITYPRDISTPALAEGMTITITRIVPYTQPDVYSENSTLIPKQIENSLDNLEYQIQQVNDKADSSVRIPDGVDYNNDEFVNKLFTAGVNAKQSETNAKQSETNAKNSELSASESAQIATTKASEASTSETNAKNSEDKSKQSETNAKASADKAKQSETNAKNSATRAGQSAQTATTKASEASTSATSAGQSAQTAIAKASEASTSETNAKQSETLAKQYADEAKESASGIGNPVSSITVQDATLTVSKADGGAEEITVDNVEHAKVAKTLAGLTELLKKLNPIGKVWTSTDPTNPRDILGFGTWEAMPAGRVLLAQGKSDWGTTYEAGSTGGEATHTNTINEMPSHNHVGSTNATGSHTHSIDDVKYRAGMIGSDGSARVSGQKQTGSAGNHTHTVTINDTGGNQPHNNMQPYISVYMWKRTA